MGAELRLPGNRALYEAYRQFCAVLVDTRTRHPLRAPNGYYPYGTIHLVPQILLLMEKSGLDLRSLVTGKTILDLGCGDGELSFFLERFGPKRVLSIDWAPTNFNGMEAARTLKQAFDSHVEFLDADVHTLDFTSLPSFDVVFCFGFLYHSRHPLWILEQLARVTSHLLLTTKVFDDEQAYVYFYDVGECNNDPTNWWCFTPKALRLMLKRTGFLVALLERLDSYVGQSHPVDLARDGRAFVYATRCEENGRMAWGF